MTVFSYLTTEVGGSKIFYWEAGSLGAEKNAAASWFPQCQPYVP